MKSRIDSVWTFYGIDEEKCFPACGLPYDDLAPAFLRLGRVGDRSEAATN
jgi:hypothetical protein